MLLIDEAKLRHLGERAHRAREAARDLDDRIREARAELRKHQDALEEPRRRREHLTDDDVERLSKPIERAKRELEFLEQQKQQADAQRQAIEPIASRCREWIETKRGQQQVDFDPDAEPAAPVTEPLKARKRIETLQGKLADALSRRDAIEAAPLPATEAKARIDEHVDGAAAAFAPNVMVAQAMSPDSMINESPFRTPILSAQGAAPEGGGPIDVSVPSLDLLPMLAWTMGDTIKAQLHAAIDARIDGDQALTTEQRAEQLATIDAELEKLGREEEDLIAGIEAAGEPIERRGDAEPRVILNAREVADPEPRYRPPERPARSPYSSFGERPADRSAPPGYGGDEANPFGNRGDRFPMPDDGGGPVERH